MANYAKLGEDNLVLTINVVKDSDNMDANGVENEQIGIDFLTKSTGWPLWKKVSKGTRKGKYLNSDGSLGDQTKAFRKNYPGIGYTYDENRDAFIPPKPFNSWILDEDTCMWESPVPMPQTTTDGKEDYYNWQESTLSWIKL
jgi:hypothetical protein